MRILRWHHNEGVESEMYLHLLQTNPKTNGGSVSETHGRMGGRSADCQKISEMISGGIFSDGNEVLVLYSG